MVRVPITSGKHYRVSILLNHTVVELVPSITGNIFLEQVPSIERGPVPFPPIFLQWTRGFTTGELEVYL